MKKILKYTVLAALTCLATMTCDAKTIQINAKNVKGDFAMQLRQMCANASYNDTVVLNFDKGTYTIDASINFRCHAIIKGAGSQQTTIIFDKGKDRNGEKAFNDHSFLIFFGKIQKPISISISDITFKLNEHKGIWWDDSEYYAIKVFLANKVDIHNVESYMANAKITNIDLRSCSNVTVTDCILSNYNNSDTGGNLWLRGEMHNINIHHNKFYKYGQDEALAFFSKVADPHKGTESAISRTNIKVTDNDFYYKSNGQRTEGMHNHVLFSVLTSLEDNEHCCDMRGFEMARNKFVTNDHCERVIFLQFQPVDKHSNFVIHDNEFTNNLLDPDERYDRMEFDIWDGSAQQDTIIIRNNTATNHSPLLTSYDGPGYTFLLVRGGNVLLDGNHVNNTANKTTSGKNYGIHLLWAGRQGGSISMRNNVCKGLARIATIESSKGIAPFSVNAVNNYFQGRTTLSCNNVERLDLNFRNNTFDCNYPVFFLQNFAKTGKVLFNNNKVTVSTGNGTFMYPPAGKASTSSMKFERLEIMGNEFHGIKSQNEMVDNITNVKKRKIKSNAFYSK